jgi:hypothetical protein
MVDHILSRASYLVVGFADGDAHHRVAPVVAIGGQVTNPKEATVNVHEAFSISILIVVSTNAGNPGPRMELQFSLFSSEPASNPPWNINHHAGVEIDSVERSETVVCVDRHGRDGDERKFA